jgi:hypothetical protein
VNEEPALDSVDDDDYYDQPSLSNSMLNTLAEHNGPQLFFGKYVAKTIPPSDPTEAMALGSLVHCMTLEPHVAHERYVIKPDGMDRRRTADKAIYACMLATGKTIVTDEQWNQSASMANALRNHDALRDLLTDDQVLIEKPIYYEYMGVPMRSKLDWLSLDLAVIIDIKTTNDASSYGFAKSCIDFGYHRQHFLYRTAVSIAFGIECRFLFACVEKDPPYSVGVHEPDDAMELAGMREVNILIEEYKDRMESGDWVQDWSKGINPLSLPSWYKEKR